MSNPVIKGIYGADMEAGILANIGAGSCAFHTQQSPFKSTGNEDSIGIVSLDDETTVLMVADGMGGYDNGKEASEITVKSVIDALQSMSGQVLNRVLLRQALSTGIEVACTHIHHYYPHAGTTIAIVIVQGMLMSTCHAGDSEIIVVDKNGKLKYSTVSHSPVGQAFARGLITEQQAIFHPRRHVVSNVVGMTHTILDFGKSYQLEKTDTLLVGTDGIFDNLFQDEILTIISNGSLQESSKKLTDTCLQRMHNFVEGIPHKPDDFSYTLFRL